VRPKNCETPVGHKNCVTSMLLRFIDNRLKDGGEDDNLTRKPRFISGKKLSGTHFCYAILM
jgi:hypothetical protein